MVKTELIRITPTTKRIIRENKLPYETEAECLQRLIMKNRNILDSAL